MVTEEPEDGRAAEVCHTLHSMLLEGRYLSISMARFPRIFGPIFVGLIRIGEKTGSLVNCLEMLSGWLEREGDVRQRVRTALTYPVIVLVVSLLCCSILMTTIAPTFLAMFETRGTPLPWPTQVVATLVRLQKSAWFWCALVLLALAVRAGWKALWKDPVRAARVYSWLFKVPALRSVLEGLSWSRYCGALSIMASCGISPRMLYKMAAQASGDPRLVVAAEDLIIAVMEGMMPSEHMRTRPQLYPRILSLSLAVGEDSGRGSLVADYLYRHYRLQLEYHLSQLTTLLEPILLAFTSALMFFLLLSLLLPIYGQLNAL